MIKNLFIFILTLLFSSNSAQSKEGTAVDYDQLLVKSYTHWEVYLHENQCYLGRVFVLLKDNNADDFLDISDAARDEFFQIGREIKTALNGLFKPDKMNYAALSNTSPVIHVHIIPRYADARTFAGVAFQDARWGQNYAPYDRAFVIEDSVLYAIRDALREQLRDS